MVSFALVGCDGALVGCDGALVGCDGIVFPPLTLDYPAFNPTNVSYNDCGIVTPSVGVRSRAL